MKCPQATCDGVMGRAGKVYLCGECGERFTLEEYASMEAEHLSREADLPFREIIVNGFPHPIARVYADLDDPGTSWQTRQTALYFTVYQLMRTVGLALVGQHLYREDPTESEPGEARRKFNQAIAGLRCPYYSDWIKLLETAADCRVPLQLDLFEGMPGEETGFQSAVKALEGRRALPVQFRLAGESSADVSLLRAFLALRNGTAHAGMLTDDACRASWELFRHWVDEVLQPFRFLASCRLLQRLFPLFHAHLPGDTLHGYDGHFFGNDPKAPRRVIYYLDSGLRLTHDGTEDAAASERLRDLLEARQIQWEMRHEEVIRRPPVVRPAGGEPGSSPPPGRPARLGHPPRFPTKRSPPSTGAIRS